MAFYLGQGDTVQLSYIAKTLQEKLYIKEGVTSNAEVKIPNAEVVNYWVKSKAKATNANPGSKQTFGEKVLIKKSVTIDQSEQLNGVIPGVNIATVSADTVNAYVVEDVIQAANNINRDFLTKVTAKATAAETTYTDAYTSILKLAAEFKTLNKDTYLEPTAAFVNAEVYAELLKNNLIYFKDNKPVSVFPFEIIEAPDLTKKVVMMNQIAMISGIAFNAVKTFDASPLGYADGVGYIGEIAYVNKATEFTADPEASGKPIGWEDQNIKPILAIA